MDIASDVLRAIETHSGLAAWVQAIGAIISLWAAIIIPRQAQWYEASAKVKRLQLALLEFANLSAEAKKTQYYGAPASAMKLRNNLDSLLIPVAMTASSITPAALKTRRQMNVVMDTINWSVKARLSIENVLSGLDFDDRRSNHEDRNSEERPLSISEQLIAVEKTIHDAHASASNLLARMKKEFRF